MAGVKRPDPIAARMRERSADRHRAAAERLREAGLVEGEEAAKRLAREEDAQAAAADDVRASSDNEDEE